MDINLGALKTEILRYLENSEFAVFHGHVGGLEGMPLITWDTEAWPDYRTFLDAARKAGVKLIVFAARELDEDEVEEATDQADVVNLPRDERREMESRLKAARRHVGQTCNIEMSFSQGQQMYVYEVLADWYDDFCDAVEELDTFLLPAGVEEDDSDSSLGGYYSNN